MMGKWRTLLFVGAAGLGLGGCVAAIIPVAAGGMIGRSKLRQHAPAGVRQEIAGVRQDKAIAGPAPVPTVARSMPAAVADRAPPLAPADRAMMKVGQAYRGDLPAPTESGAAPGAATPPAAMATAPAAASPVRWSDVMRLAAATSLQKPVASALLARGSTTATPHWLPCGDRPVAVLVNLPIAGTAFFDGAMDNLGAIETMGVTLLFVSDQPAAVVARQRKLLVAGHVTAPVPGTTLFIDAAGTGAATRATLGGQYCVVAVVGSRATDFPNATLPGTPGANPGWFLIR